MELRASTKSAEMMVVSSEFGKKSNADQKQNSGTKYSDQIRQ